MTRRCPFQPPPFCDSVNSAQILSFIPKAMTAKVQIPRRIQSKTIIFYTGYFGCFRSQIIKIPIAGAQGCSVVIDV